MSIARFLSILVVIILPVIGLAQNIDDAAKEKLRRHNLLVDQILADVTNLQLGENRAFVYAKAGGLIWNSDEKRAKALFRNAVSELINAQSLASTARNPQVYHDLLNGQSTRPAILNLIASRDAEYALESLERTRPAVIEKAMVNAKAKDAKIGNLGQNSDHFAQNELNLEQNFIQLAADQNPERAVKFLNDALKKGLSGETFRLLKKLHGKAPAAADEIAGEVLSKVLTSGFLKNKQPNYQNMNLATEILTDFVRERNPDERTLKFDESKVRGLADKLIAFYVEEGSKYGYLPNGPIIQIAEKLTPGAVASLKSAGKNITHRSFHHGIDPEYSALINSNPTAEKLLSEAKKFPVEIRSSIYHAAANKIADSGDYGSAAALLSENFSDDALESAVSSLNWYYAHHLMNKGNFVQAERMIDEFPVNNRQSAFLQLANTVFNKDRTENKAYALALLAKVRVELPEKPENSNELSVFTQLISAYLNIEPAEAFRLFEPLVPQLNALSDASAVLQAFQGGGNIRQGEFLMTQGANYGFYVDFSMLRTMAIADLDRTTSLIDGFTRREMRLMLKIQLAESTLN